MRSIKLRTVLFTTTCTVTLLGLVVSIALVILTTRLHARSAELAAAVESVALTQQASNDLLLHDRAIDSVARYEAERELRGRIDAAAVHVTSKAEQRALTSVREAVRQYLATPDDPRLHEAAYAALGSLVEINRDQARAARAATARWDAISNRIGVAVAAMVIVIAAGLLWWLHAHVFRPMLAVADAMARFGAGDPTARAAEAGPVEVRAMSRQFNVMATTLAVQRHAQVAFLGGVAHDLRSPLSAMTMTIGLLDDPAHRRVAERMQRITARLDRMINDLLDVTRIDAGGLRIEAESLDVREIVREVVALAERDLDGQQLRVQVPEEPLIIRGDPMRLEQAIGNLVSNAIKYSPGGAEVEVRVSNAATSVVIEVEDHGIGMSAEDRGLAFEPFRRGASAARFAGAGLGLYVTRGIVEAHGGRIAVESVAGSGSVFRVHLPT